MKLLRDIAFGLLIMSGILTVVVLFSVGVLYVADWLWGRK